MSSERKGVAMPTKGPYILSRAAAPAIYEREVLAMKVKEALSRVMPRSPELVAGQTPRSTRNTRRSHASVNPGNEQVVDLANRQRPGRTQSPFGVFL